MRTQGEIGEGGQQRFQVATTWKPQQHRFRRESTPPQKNVPSTDCETERCYNNPGKAKRVGMLSERVRLALGAAHAQVGRRGVDVAAGVRVPVHVEHRVLAAEADVDEAVLLQQLLGPHPTLAAREGRGGVGRNTQP